MREVGELPCCCFPAGAAACNVARHSRSPRSDIPYGQVRADLKDGNFPLSVENGKINKAQRHGSKSTKCILFFFFTLRILDLKIRASESFLL